MGRPRKGFYVKVSGYRAERPFFDLVVGGRKFRLAATDQAAAEAEGRANFERISIGAVRSKGPTGITLRDGFTAYLASDSFKLSTPLADQHHPPPAGVDRKA